MSEQNQPSLKRTEYSKVRILLRRLKNQPQDYLLSQEEELILLSAYQAGVYPEQCMEALIRLNIRLVRKTAIQMSRVSRIPTSDLESCGLEGLMQGVQRFDTKSGYRFSTYAVYWIKNRVRRYITSHQNAIRLPEHVHDKVSQVKKTIAKLSHNGTYPTISEISKHSGLAPHWVSQCVDIMSRIVVSSSEDVVLAGIGVHKEEVMISDTSTDGDMLSAAARENLYKALSALNDRQKKMLLDYCGWEGERQTLEQIGTRLGISREAVRQNIAKALNTIRETIDIEEVVHDQKISRGFSPYQHHNVG